MKKYGELKRITNNGITYIIGAEKCDEHPIRDLVHIPNLYFYVPKKQARKVKGKNISKGDLSFGLFKNTDKKLLLELLAVIKEYLNTIKPVYLHCIPHYESEYDFLRRQRVYFMFLDNNGYDWIYEHDGTGGMVFKRREE